MPFALHRDGFPGISASGGIKAGDAVSIAAGASQRTFVSLASSNGKPFGIALATAATANDAFAIIEEGSVAIVTAGASLGHGAEIGVASTNGALGPVASGAGWSIGQSMSPAAAGEDFSLYVNPRVI